jgi:hypothetical protein
VFLVVYYSYDTARDAVAGSPHRARADAGRIVDLERALHLFHEHSVQHAVLAHRSIVWLADGYYGWIHFAVPIAVAAALLLVGDARRWTRWRNTFWLLCALALIGFWLFPLAPPRLLPGGGFVDTMVAVGGPGISARSASAVGNAFAAMPSLHAGWSLWACSATWSLTRRPIVRALALLDPLLTLGVIVATANHYLLDAVAGWAAIALAFVLALGLDRLTGAGRRHRRGGNPLR